MKNINLPQRMLGASDISISVAGLGTVKFGRNQAMKYPNSYDLPDSATIDGLLTCAKECGINWLDTAPAYGLSEQRLGQTKLSQDFLISTKVGEEFARGKSYFDFSAKHTLMSIERSLTQLKRETLDIVFIHSDGNDLEIIHNSGCLESLEDAKQAGKIRAYGMSCKTVEGALTAISLVDTLMLTRNPDYLADTPAIETAAKNNIGIIIKKGFGSGHLFNTTPIDKICDFLFQAPITALVTGTLNKQHLIANCSAIAKAANAHSL